MIPGSHGPELWEGRIRYRGIDVTVVLPSSKKNRELFEGGLDMIKDPELIAVAGDDRFDFW